MNNENKKEVDLLEYWKIILKRKWVMVSFTGALLFFTGIYSFLAKPLYKATTTLLIEDEISKMLNIYETFGYQPQFGQDLRFFNTQLTLLKSLSLSERVARKMSMSSRSEFQTGKDSKKGPDSSSKDTSLFSWMNPKSTAKKETPSFTSRANPFLELAKQIREGIEVKPIRDTKMVEVSYISPLPTASSDVVNTLAEEFINFSIEKRYETTQQTSNFLSEQISSLQEDLAVKEREMQKYSQDKDLVFLSNTESTTVQKFEEINTAYTQAIMGRIQAESTYRELREINIDTLTQFMNNPLIQELKTQYARMKNEFDEKSKIFKPNYPEMVQLRARMDSMKNELLSELQKAADAAEAEYRSALKKEGSLKDLLDRQRGDVSKMNSNAILYNSLKIEVENKRKLLNNLVEKQNETLVSSRLAGLKTSNISIIDRAEIPDQPISPKKKLNLILALFFGLFGGIGLCFIIEQLDNTVKGPEDIEKISGLPSLGVIPFLSPDGMMENKKDSYFVDDQSVLPLDKNAPNAREALPLVKSIELVNLHFPKLSISEDYRTVRTSILLSQAENPPKTILVTSCLPEEGKTSTLVNMAVSFAQLNEKILIIEADLRKPRLGRVFKVRNIKGLSGYLTGKVSLKDAILMTSVENIWLLPCGPIPPNPVELINSKKMKEMLEEVKNLFSVVLIDSPPVLAVVDSIILSSMVDCVALVTHAGKTTRKLFLHACDELKKAKAKIIGVILNKVNVKRGRYHDMDYYRYSQAYEYRADKPE